MYAIPIESPNHACDRLIIILNQKENLDAMAQADPATISPQSYARGRTLVNPHLMICHEEDTPELLELLTRKPRDLVAIVEYLERGFQFKPERGDGLPPRPMGGE